MKTIHGILITMIVATTFSLGWYLGGAPFAETPHLDRCVTAAQLVKRGDGTQAIILSGPAVCKVVTLEMQGSQWDFEHGGIPVITIERKPQ